jgi:hypothetical protein
MSPVYTIIVGGVPYCYTAEQAPPIGLLVTLDGLTSIARVVRSADGGRVYIGEAATEKV